MKIIEDLHSAPMSRFQVVAISVALLLLLMDGYDLAVMAFVAPSLSEQWTLPADSLGYLISAGLFGTAVGSIVLAPIADRIGRRPLTLACLVIIIAGLVGSGFSTNFELMFASRVVTGLGIGGLAATLNVLVSEMSSNRRRGLAMGVFAAGFSIGATVCGIVARWMIPAFGWQSMFFVGAAVTIALLLVCVRLLPESLEFLLTKQPPSALERANSILDKIGMSQLSELPAPDKTESIEGSVREVLSRTMIIRTILLWIGYGCLVAGYYFFSTWLPKIMATTTGDKTIGITLGTIANFGGILGCLVFGVLTSYFAIRKVLITMLTAGGVACLAFAAVLGQTGLAMVVAALIGLLLMGGIVGFYTQPHAVYSPRARATGNGWMIGIGRLVSIAAPVVTGYLIAAHWTPASLFVAYSVPLFVAALCIVTLGMASRRPGMGSMSEVSPAPAETR
ncbi:aromatic acid/H+ symport family MFS transporter [Rhodococcus oxybenzonivorans]|uniref:Aromatic acid/H+ symport family MFS transporter n=1 Tax=Rhodococcus oxybenzonivorans TaxID=1990687 RepID=A0A2S2BZ30_9NOCA|nr:MFS transporter [Rhodococcus oxybenzonivorans]AWK73911.1 aromatic acid/H+ symport family MFS transporter [Rhodococcus oxybenzonivorans]